MTDGKFRYAGDRDPLRVFLGGIWLPGDERWVEVEPARIGCVAGYVTAGGSFVYERAGKVHNAKKHFATEVEVLAHLEQLKRSLVDEKLAEIGRKRTEIERLQREIDQLEAK